MPKRSPRTLSPAMPLAFARVACGGAGADKAGKATAAFRNVTLKPGT